MCCCDRTLIKKKDKERGEGLHLPKICPHAPKIVCTSTKLLMVTCSRPSELVAVLPKPGERAPQSRCLKLKLPCFSAIEVKPYARRRVPLPWVEHNVELWISDELIRRRWHAATEQSGWMASTGVLSGEVMECWFLWVALC